MDIAEEIKRAARILKRGGVVAFPTETVYGLGARYSSAKALKKIYTIKGRPFDNPLIVHISDQSQFELLAQKIPLAAQNLIEKFWPGPLTLVCNRSPRVSNLVTAGLETVAIRMPNHPIALELIRTLGEPIAAPSANRSGRPSPTRPQDVYREIGAKVDLILDGGETELGIESTVIDLTQDPPQLLRPGSITIESLREFLPELKLYSKLSKNPPASPGMKQAHYQPNCPVIMINSQNWIKTLLHWQKKNVRVGAISCKGKIPSASNIVFKKCFGGNKIEYARNLYSYFFDAENARAEVLLVETVNEKGIGLAVMDRLIRASTTRN